MKLRKGKNSRARVKARKNAGEWSREEGLTAPGSQNHKKGGGATTPYSPGKAKERSRKAAKS